MRRNHAFTALVLTLTLVAAACGDDSTTTTTAVPGETSTTVTTDATSTTVTIAATTTTTTTQPAGPVANGPALVTEGDVNETARAFQWLLNCNGYGPLTEDGAYGQASRTAMEAAQTDLNREATGSPDDETLALLSRSCADTRPVTIEDHDFGSLEVVGNASPDDPDVLSIRIAEGDQMSISVAAGDGVTFDVLNSAGMEIGTKSGDGSWETIFSAAGDYLIQVSALAPTTFQIDLQFFKSDAPVDEVRLTHNGLLVGPDEYFVGEQGFVGDDVDRVIVALTVALGPPSNDSGWEQHPLIDGAESRFVFWENFSLFFDDLELPGLGAVRHFGSYSYIGPPAGIFTVMDGITVGNTAGEVIAAVNDYRPAEGLDQYQWVRMNISDLWVLGAGNAEFGFLCFVTDNSGPAEPGDGEIISQIHAGLPCTFGGE